MGAVTFSLDVRLVERLKEALPISIFVETGTFEGDTVAAMAPLFDKIISVEISKPLWETAQERFKGESKVELHLGNSPEELSRIRPLLGDASTLFWLDAHWCVAKNAAGDESQCPLLEEIFAIDRLGDTSVVLIDDARLFLAPPPEPHDVTQWPSFDQIVAALRLLSDRHELMVINDVIAFYPKTVNESISGYAREYGVDWLRASQSLDENADLRVALEEKEAVIQTLHKAIEGTASDRYVLAKDFSEKDAVIQTLGKAAEGAADDHRMLVKSLEEKDAVIQTVHRAVEGATTDRYVLGKGFEEKDAVTQTLRNAVEEAANDHGMLVKSLGEKEAVIQELSKAVAAYRSAFPVLENLIRPVNRMVSATRSVTHQSRNIVAPRLGNLNQHAPRKLRLPPHYARSVHVAQPPRISIVTPSFKQAAFIERTIKSVLDQSYPNLEYYVQDGGSGDGTAEILERYADRLAGWESRPDSGQSQAINLGFARTSGEIMAWLNSDDIMLPGALAYVAAYFDKQPAIDVVYGHRILIDEDDQQIGRWVLPAHNNDVLSWADYIPQETLFWRRRIWDKVGGQVDESFRFAMDWDLLVRFRAAGARFHRLPRFLGAFRVHAKQKTSAAMSEVGFAEMGRIRERELGRQVSHGEVRRAVSTYLLRHLISDRAYRIKQIFGFSAQ